MRQSLDLETKELLTNQRIFQAKMKFHNTYVAFSGGKDSTVLLHLVRKQFPDIPAVFVDTGLEYPEIREFVKTIDNVIWLKPKMNFKKVIEEYGFPLISKMQSQYIECARNAPKDSATRQIRMNGKYEDEKEFINIFGEKQIEYSGIKNYGISECWKYLIDAPFKISDKCCNVMKKEPFHRYEKETNRKAFIGIMADESIQRQKQYIQHGCNAFNMSNPQSRPIMFWKEKDIWDYIKKHNLKYSSIYDKGLKRTGCIFCGFGVHCEKRPNRFDILKKLHPKLYDYCMDKLGIYDVLKYIGIDMNKKIISNNDLFNE